VSALLNEVPRERSEQTKVLAMLAISWGWRLFGEFLLLCAGSRDDPAAVGQEVLEHLMGSRRISGKEDGS
jgi:hypothetical protein